MPVRNVYFMRHSERSDELDSFVGDNGRYIQSDLNLPSSFPQRQGGFLMYNQDCGLTFSGCGQAEAIGRASHAANVQVDAVVSSPSYRSLCTAKHFLIGINKPDARIRLEYGLQENLVRSGRTHPPVVLTRDELLRANFPVSASYRPLHGSLAYYNQEQTLDQVYQRHSDVVDYVLQNVSGDLVIVGHASTLDMGSRLLTGGAARSKAELSAILQYCGYGSFVRVKQSQGRWQIVEAPVAQYTFKGLRFDKSVLTHGPGFLARFKPTVEDNCSIM